MREAVESLFRARDADGAQGLDRAPAREVARHVLVRADRLHDLMTHLEEGMERRERVLEDHRDAGAADSAQVLRRHGQEILSVEHDAARDGRVRETGQPEDRLRRHALAGAGLPDDAQRLPRAQRQGDALDGMDDAVDRLEGDVQVLDL